MKPYHSKLQSGPKLNLLVPAATLAALLAYAAAMGPSDVETGYLAFLTTLVLVPVAFLAPRGSLALASSAVLIVTSVWAIPASGARGSSVVALLLFSLGMVLARRLQDNAALPLALTVPAALALQALVRSDRLLRPNLDFSIFVSLVALPVVGAWAITRLSTSRGTTPMLLTAGTLLAFAPGFRVASTLALVAFAVGEALRERGIRDRASWVGVGLVFLPAVLWRPRFALVLALAVLLDVRRESGRVRAAVAATALALALSPAALQGLGPALIELAWMPLLLPALIKPRNGRTPHVLTALLLGFAGLRFAPEETALIAPITLAALAVAREGTLARLQGFWTTLLLAGSVLLAAYPWVRSFPLEEAIGLAGLERTWLSAAVLIAIFACLSNFLDALPRFFPWSRLRPFPVALTVLSAFVALELPSSGQRPLDDVVTLTREAPDRSFDLAASSPIKAVVLDSYLSEGARVAAGVEVGRVVLEGWGGLTTVWPLLSGEDTGEWAARRSDVRRQPGLVTPEPWLTWVAPGGGFLAQRYRSTSQPLAIDRPRRVRVLLAPDLPPEVTLTVYYLGLRP